MNRRRRCYLTLILTLILGLQEGNIALWRAETGVCIQRFPYRPETLPPPVVSDLENGIPFPDTDFVREAVENLLS